MPKRTKHRRRFQRMRRAPRRISRGARRVRGKLGGFFRKDLFATGIGAISIMLVRRFLAPFYNRFLGFLNINSGVDMVVAGMIDTAAGFDNSDLISAGVTMAIADLAEGAVFGGGGALGGGGGAAGD